MDLGNQIGYRNLILIPLGGECLSHYDYTLAASAIDEFKLFLTETDEEGNIFEVLAASTLDKDILFIEGEELIGAKKNRLLYSSVLMPSKSYDFKMPVCGVEENRWSYISRRFVCGNHAPPLIRKCQNANVFNNVQQHESVKSGQHQLWHHIKRLIRDFNIDSPTAALYDIYLHQIIHIEEFLNVLQYPEGARGVVAFINGQFAALDLFDKPLTLQKLWDKLLIGYTIEALAAVVREKYDFSQEEVKDMLRYLGQRSWKSFPAVGLGQEYRFQDERFLGQSLIAEGVCVHMSVFPSN